MDPVTTSVAGARRVAITDGVLESLRQVDQSLVEAIAKNEAAIPQIEAGIVRLEEQNKEKHAHQAALESEIRNRRAALQSNMAGKQAIGYLALMFGLPVVAFGAAAMAGGDDARIRELEAALRSTENASLEIAWNIHEYGKTKIALMEKIDGLKADAARIREKIESIDGTPRPDLDTAIAPIVILEEKVDAREALLAVVAAHVAALETIRKEAAKVGVSLDALLADQKAILAKATTDLQASREELLTLVKWTLAPEPDVAASKWLEGRLVKRTATLLDAAGIQGEPFARFVVKSALHGADENDAPRLIEDLVAKWAAANAQGASTVRTAPLSSAAQP